MDVGLIVALVAAAACAVGGYLLATHIHKVAAPPVAPVAPPAPPPAPPPGSSTGAGQ